MNAGPTQVHFRDAGVGSIYPEIALLQSAIHRSSRFFFAILSTIYRSLYPISRSVCANFPSGRELRKPQRDTNSFHPAQDTLT